MFSKISSLARTGLVALTAAGMLPATVSAAPFAPTIKPTVADNVMKPIKVQGEGRDWSASPALRWPKVGGFNGRNWNGGNWNGRHNWDGRGNWGGRGHYRRNWRRNNWHGGHGGWGWGGSGIALGFGIPLAYGLYGGYGGYYDEPTYRPRRAYGGSTHVEWCYNRYRSYREWDNTYQPYHGPRRLCYSPYG